MADHAKPIRVSLLLEHVPKKEQRDHFSVRMLEQCIDLDVPVYVSIPTGYIAHTNSVGSIIDRLALGGKLRPLLIYGDPLASLSPDVELQFFRLAKDTLRTLINSRRATQHLFTMGGLSRSSETGRGEESGLERTQLSKAFLRPVHGGMGAKDRVTLVPNVGGIYDYDYHLNIAIADVYIEDARVSEILSSTRGVDRAPCPYDNLEVLSPGIYWMYIGARSLNEGRTTTHGGEEDWLEEHAPDGIYNAKQLKTAAKFVQLVLNRSKGRNHEKVKILKMEALIDNQFDKKYKEDFVSPGLALILLATDWWWDLKDNPTRTYESLKAYLNDLGFYEENKEIDHLAYLIAGPNMEIEVESNGGGKVRPIDVRKLKRVRS